MKSPVVGMQNRRAYSESLYFWKAKSTWMHLSTNTHLILRVLPGQWSLWGLLCYEAEKEWLTCQLIRKGFHPHFSFNFAVFVIVSLMLLPEVWHEISLFSYHIDQLLSITSFMEYLILKISAISIKYILKNKYIFYFKYFRYF